MIFKQQRYIAGAYERLSHEDDLEIESQSIESQRQIITQYCQSKNITIAEEYTDDGYSGTNFDRPSFKRLLNDIKSGKVNLVIVKDLSRLGRNYVDCGYYIEQLFDQYNVRFIAIDDGVDTLQGDNMVVPIKNVMNDWYAKDISRKTKSSLTARAKSGQYLASKPAYGYIKSPDDYHKLIIDKESAEVVKKIFQMASTSYGYNKIVKHLTGSKVLTPQSYFVKQNPDYYKRGKFTPHCDWNNKTVQVILNNLIYLGQTVYGKTCSKKIRSKEKVIKPQEEWIVRENTHEPIISRDLWELAHSNLCKRKRETAKGEIHIFSGILYCSDCGAAMTFYNREMGKELNGEFICGTYKRKGKDKCSTHYVTFENVYSLVLQDIKSKAKLAAKDEQRFIISLEKENDLIINTKTAYLIQDLSVAKARIEQLDQIINKLYEDRVAGMLTTERYAKMVSNYETEQKELQEKVATAEKIQSDADKRANKLQKFTQIIRECTEIEMLDRNILNTIIKSIKVGHSVKNDITGKKDQSFEIEYDLC